MAHATHNLTPEEHEARIAELRSRRRARMRVLAFRSALGAAVLTVLALAALYWLLMTLGGRDFLLSQIVVRLPAGTELTWQRAQGPAAGPLTMHGVRFVQRVCPDVEGEPVPYGKCPAPRALTFTAKRIVIDPDIRPLLGRLLRLDAIEVEGATLDLPESDEPFELPRWPEVLPQIAPPLALQADIIRIDGFKLSRAGEAMIDIRSVRGGLDARQGLLRLHKIAVDSDRGRFTAHGEYAPGDNFRTDLTASALLPAPFARTRPRIGMVARGDLDAMDVAISGRVPDPLRAQLTLRGAEPSRWTLRASSTALDPALLTGSGQPGTPLAFDLRGDGVGGAATLSGTLRRGTLSATLQPSKVRLEEQVLTFEPLVLDVFDGRITVRGRGDFKDPDNATFRYAINARGVAWGPTPEPGQQPDPSARISGDADFGIAGRTDAWAAIGKATLTRDTQTATIDFDGRGNGERMTLRQLRAAMPTGTLDAGGDVAWSPALGWKLDATLTGFDPGYFAPEFNGAVNGILASTGTTRTDGGLDVSVDARDLGGNLRGRKLQGRAAFEMHGPASGQTRTDYEGEVALGLGSSRIDAKGHVSDKLDIDATLAPLQLNDLLPDADGTLRGTLSVTGTRTAPDIEADLTGAALRYSAYRIDTLRAHGRLPWRTSNGNVTLDASGLDVGIPVDTLALRARGAVENLDADLDARGAIGALTLSGSAQRRGANWQGTLASLQLAPARGAAWRLRSPARFAQNGNNWTLSQSCFGSDAGGSLCASADWPQRGVTVDGDGLPLALAVPYLPERDDGRPWILDGTIAIDGTLRPSGNAWAGNVRLRSASGGVRMNPRARRSVISYRDLAFEADFDALRIQATLASAFNDDGRIDARISTGWDAYAPLTGEVALSTDELTWMELFSPDIVEPTGRLDGRITLSGTRAQPGLGGQAQLAQFAAELPSLAIALQDGNAHLDAQPDGSARIDGSVGTGQGVLRIDGTLGWQGDSTPLALNIRGNDVLVSDTRDLRAVISPDVQVRYAARQPLQVSGTVTVPSARMDLERLDDGVSTSPDVVVLDPEDPEQTAATPLQLDLTLAMGDDVRLDGFGLEGTLGGSMRVRSTPGREMTALGTLEVGGRYEAYGQELDITRGRLVWSNTPVSDPVLDIRAERKVGDITAGIDVDGRASSPQARVWTDPPSDENEALAYLTLGRPLSSLSGDQARQIDAASAALTAGGSLVASQLGKHIGLDDAGVMQSRALGGSVLGIGKQLSPKLYVGFGVSLLGTGQVLTLKYLLRKGFDVEVETSTLENRGSINWRKEK
jgi:translocation and assembly module TamB